MTTSHCRSCGAEIIWVTTLGGKSMPLDAKPITLFVLDGEGSQRSGNPRIKITVIGRVSHFSSCPHGDAWRRE